MTEQSKPRRLILQRTGPAFGKLKDPATLVYTGSQVVNEKPPFTLQEVYAIIDNGDKRISDAVRNQVFVEARIVQEINNLLAEHIPQQSAAVRCALRQALGAK